MQTLFIVAGVLTVVTGLIHSVFGEKLIFQHLRNGSLVPAMGAPPLRERNIRIIWATWHLATVFGFAIAGILFWLGLADTNQPLKPVVMSAIIFAYLGGSILVLIGTKGRHPGWIALLLVSALTWAAATAT
jgi:hypothetical protein